MPGHNYGQGPRLLPVLTLVKRSLSLSVLTVIKNHCHFFNSDIDMAIAIARGDGHALLVLTVVKGLTPKRLFPGSFGYTLFIQFFF